MRAFGSDRIRRGSGEQWMITCRRSKGWTPRAPKTMTSAEFPGTAILCGDEYFEVVREEQGSAGGVRYVLEPWREEHTIRVSEPYDEESEVRREREYFAAVRRTHGRRAANALGILTGHLPAAVQERLASDIGILPAKLTLLSLLLPFAFIVYVTQDLARGILDPNSAQMPLWMAAAAMYAFVETALRFLIVWLQNRPIGSALGLLAYSAFWLVTPGRRNLVAPMVIRAPAPRLVLETPPDVAQLDAYQLREPFLTLLTPDEQRALAERYGFEYARHANAVAAVILVFALAGIITSVVTLKERFTLSAAISLTAAAFLAGEQVIRLSRLPRSPAGSVLGVIVRPFARVLFEK